MTVNFTKHAKERMKKYELNEDAALDTVNKPDSIIKTYNERNIYQKRINDYVIRAIVEENEGIKTVITIYKARSDRYEV